MMIRKPDGYDLQIIFEFLRGDIATVKRDYESVGN